MTHKISLEASRELNLKVLRLFDTSQYCDDDIENYLIEVLPPNKTQWVTFNVQKNFSLILNSSNLQYKKVSKSEDLADLPDGIYEIKQSYKPNIHSLSKYYHFRLVSITLKYVEQLCNHFSKQCSLTDLQFEEITDELTLIRNYLDAAKYEVEIYHNKSQGIAYYNKAVELIKKLDENACGCI